MELYLPAILAFVVALVAGRVFIPALHQLKFGQAIREEGPQGHLKKAGTPTMGGLIFLTGILFSVLAYRLFHPAVLFVVVSMLAFGSLGFLDDYLKVVKKHNLGLRAKHKLAGQLLFSVVLAIWAGHLFGTSIRIPFITYQLDLGLVYYPFFVFVAVAVTNAVNLTDGLDGLSSSVTIVVLSFFAWASFAVGIPVLQVLALIMIGGLLGFLVYNRYPAKVFMGDLGSLALGGAVTGFAFATGLVLLIPIVGLIYFVETLSVMIQVASFKMTGKRVFKMAPIHHHFELSGWNEVKIVMVFSIVTVVMSIVGILSL